MTAIAMNHFTILTDDLDTTLAFYARYLDLHPGARPPFDFPGAWLYARDGRQAILHVVAGKPREVLVKGVIDHMAFTGGGLAGTLDKLRADGIGYDLRQLPGYGTWQLFFVDPNGARIELDYDAAEHTPRETTMRPTDVATDSAERACADRPTAPATFDASRMQIERASRSMPGGVSSNFRVGMMPGPLVFERAEGACLIDLDGNRLIDYYLGMGPMILGHDPQEVKRAVIAQLERGILYGGQSRIEAEAAELFCALVPCAEQVRFAGSGSEAVQLALRLARAATGRSTIVKFEGHYHGWLDSVLVSGSATPETAGPADAPQRNPGSDGQDEAAWRHTEVLGWNDLASLERRLARGDVAGVIMEPAMCNAGAIPPAPGYLEGARAACSRHGTVLIFDEVITGFRLAPGGAQQLFGVTPDLATFAKSLANGFPVAAVAGRASIMALCAGAGVMHGGTYNGQPVSMAAALATLRALADGAVMRDIEPQGRRLMAGIEARLASAGITASVAGWPQVFHVGFGLAAPARDYRDLMRMDRARYQRFAHALLRHRVRVLERGAWFMSRCHDDRIVDDTLAAVEAAVERI